MSFEILTETSCDLTKKQIVEYRVRTLPHSYYVDGQEHLAFIKEDTADLKKFYADMRAGKIVTTSQPPVMLIEQTVRDILDEGRDLLYIGFSSGLSSSYSEVSKRIEALRPLYPERKIFCIDTLCASAGTGLLIHYAAKKRAEGFSLEETAQWVEDNRLKVVHWFTVDDLMFLHRGGRVSTASAVAGILTGIKPVLHVNDKGHLILMEKARGRKKALKSLVDHMEKTAYKPIQDQTIFITHGDALKDAEFLAEEIRRRFGPCDISISYINQTIGAHAGPGTIALFFLGEPR